MTLSVQIDRVRVATATTGTGTMTLGSADTGYAGTGALVNAAVYSYCIEDGANWEVGQGTYTASGATLSRTFVDASSNSGSAISLSGAAKVFMTPTARDLAALAPLASPSFTGTAAMAGLLDLSGGSAGQVKFPASQNASADANTLDDYEEGDWTPDPRWGGNNVGMTLDSGYTFGKYTKVGRLVTIQFFVYITNKGSSTGSLTVGGLPFSPPKYILVPLAGFLATGAYCVFPMAAVQPSASALTVYRDLIVNAVTQDIYANNDSFGATFSYYI